MSKEFWNWVANRKAHDNPRGDFIRDSRDLLATGVDPGKAIRRVGTSNEALTEYNRLCEQWGNNLG